MGELRNKCVANHPSWWVNVTYEEWYEWISNSSNWVILDDMPMLCGNLTGAQKCKPGNTCLRVGENPNHGYTSFDNFMWSMLTTFQLITLDYWENTYNMIIATCGPMSVSFFTIVVFFGSFYLINLMLAVVALSYEEEAEITQEERRKDLIDHRDDSTFSFDPTHLNLKQLNKQSSKKLDSRKNVIMASYSRKKTRRRKKGKEGKAPNNKSNTSGNNNNSENVDDNKSIDTNKSGTPTPNASPRHSNSSAVTVVRPPQTLALQKTRGLLQQAQVIYDFHIMRDLYKYLFLFISISSSTLYPFIHLLALPLYSSIKFNSSSNKLMKMKTQIPFIHYEVNCYRAGKQVQIETLHSTIQVSSMITKIKTSSQKIFHTNINSSKVVTWR